MYQPSPSTNKLVELAIERANNPKTILDLGCRTGWIARRLKDTFPQIIVAASDIDDSEFSLDPDIHWFTGSMFEPLRGMKFDLIVCNPNYLSQQHWESIGRPEPKIAFTDGKDGFSMIEQIMVRAGQLLNPGGMVALEIDPTHAHRLPGWEILTFPGTEVARFAIFVDSRVNG